MTNQQMLVVVGVLVSVVGVVRGYPNGPPLAVCGNMYPTGHHTDAKNMTPPYVLTAVPTTVSAGATVTVTLNATGDPTYPYYEGVFVQARKADCQDDSPLGAFSIAPNDPFLKPLDCGGKTAVSQKTASHQTSISFTWTVPNDYQGKVYFRATVVKNKMNFWTNVFSPYVTFTGDSSAAPTQRCKVITKESELSSAPALTTSLFLVVFVTVFAFLCKL